MIQITVQKNLICLEDLLLGVGTVNQTRGVTTAPVTKINGSNLPYDADFTMKELIDDLQTQIDSLPNVVDQDGNILTGLMTVSASQPAGMTNRLWVKTISGTEKQLFFNTVMMLRWNPAAGNLIFTLTDEYIAADAVVTAAFIAADLVVHNAYIAADAVVTAAYIAADVAAAAVRVTAEAALTAEYIAADVVLNDKIDHRVSVVQQADVAASTTATKTIVYTAGSWTKITVSSNFTIAFTMPAGEVCSMVLQIINGGAYTITWPAGLLTPGGTVPALTAAGTDHVVIYQDGNNIRSAVVSGKDMKAIP